MAYLRLAVAGAVIGGVVALVVAALTNGGAWLASTLWPTPDANIGVGIVLLATRAVLLVLGAWLGLRWIGVPGAPFIATGTLLLCGINTATALGVLGSTLTVAAYTGLASGVASIIRG